MTVSLEQPSCGNCAFYHAMTKVCRRFPPVPVVLGMRPVPLQPDRAEPVINAIFPGMMPHGWCGEHRPKDEEESVQ